MVTFPKGLLIKSLTMKYKSLLSILIFVGFAHAEYKFPTYNFPKNSGLAAIQKEVLDTIQMDLKKSDWSINSQIYTLYNLLGLNHGVVSRTIQKSDLETMLPLIALLGLTDWSKYTKYFVSRDPGNNHAKICYILLRTFYLKNEENTLDNQVVSNEIKQKIHNELNQFFLKGYPNKLWTSEITGTFSEVAAKLFHLHLPKEKHYRSLRKIQIALDPFQFNIEDDLDAEDIAEIENFFEFYIRELEKLGTKSNENIATIRRYIRRSKLLYQNRRNIAQQAGEKFDKYKNKPAQELVVDYSGYSYNKQNDPSTLAYEFYQEVERDLISNLDASFVEPVTTRDYWGRPVIDNFMLFETPVDIGIPNISNPGEFYGTFDFSKADREVVLTTIKSQLSQGMFHLYRAKKIIEENPYLIGDFFNNGIGYAWGCVNARNGFPERWIKQQKSMDNAIKEAFDPKVSSYNVTSSTRVANLYAIFRNSLMIEVVKNRPDVIFYDAKRIETLPEYKKLNKKENFTRWCYENLERLYPETKDVYGSPNDIFSKSGLRNKVEFNRLVREHEDYYTIEFN